MGIEHDSHRGHVHLTQPNLNHVVTPELGLENIGGASLSAFPGQDL